MRKLILLAFATPLAAQTPTPPVRLINAPEATSKPLFGAAVSARQLPNGNVVVNDIGKRQLVMFDPSLQTPTVIADSVSGGANSYGPAPGSLTYFYGDSLLFIDPRDLSMFVISPAGTIARVAAVPRSQDAMAMGSNALGAPALDTKGRLVYRGVPNLRMMGPPPGGRAGGAGPVLPDFPDSAAIVRVDLATRKLDTAGFFKIAKVKMNVTQSDRGFSVTSEQNPMPLVDDFAVVSDGSVAIVRGQEYRVDWISPDGTLTPSAKIPFDWQRLSDEDKVAVIDSAKAAFEKMRASAGTQGGPGAMAMSTGRVTIIAGGDGPMAMGARAGGPAAGGPQVNFISPSELPDYRPAFTPGAASADLDGNLWIRTTAVRKGAVAAGPIYDVINRKGELVDRLQVPAGRQIIGFGRNGVIYMAARDDKGMWLEQTKRPAAQP